MYDVQIFLISYKNLGDSFTETLVLQIESISKLVMSYISNITTQIKISNKKT